MSLSGIQHQISEPNPFPHHEHNYCVPAQRRTLKMVAVHLGAGMRTCDSSESLRIAKTICEEVMLNIQPVGQSNPRKNGRKIYLDPVDAESAVVQLVKKMEDQQILNCGLGSNLNMYGQVECDASLMSDRSLMWAGVGSISGCKNPILLAKSLYDHNGTPQPLNLVQPNLLVGSGARLWMRKHCPTLAILESKMISPRALKTYQKWKSRYDEAVRTRISQVDCDNSTKDSNSGFYSSRTTSDNLKKQVRFAANSISESNDESEESSSSPFDHLDTVGAVAVDCDNNFASAISSGGLLLKCKGRVGQAAVPGAGCWSENSVAITTTGVGEHLTLNLFARKVYEKIQTLRLLYDLGHVERNSNQTNAISAAIEECFEELANSPALAYVSARERLAGLLSVESFNSRDSPNRCAGEKQNLYLTYGHNTPTLCVGYMTCEDIVGHSLMSRQLIDGGSGVGASSDLTSADAVSGNNHSDVDGEGCKRDLLSPADTSTQRTIVVKTLKFSLDLDNQSIKPDQ